MSWWSNAGRPGGLPRAWLATGDPLSFAGLPLGGADLDERSSAGVEGPWPGVPGARRAMSWNDSVAVIALPDPGSSGFGVPLVALQSVVVARGPTRTRATVSFGQGSSGWEDDALGIERGDSLQGFRVEILNGSRGITGALGDGSRRVWDVSGRTERGAHQIQIAYRQQGASGHLPMGLGQNAEGESGRVGWRWEHRGWWTELRAARGDDRHLSYGDTLVGSRRDAGGTTAEAEVGGAQLGGVSHASVAFGEANVRRTTADTTEFDRDARSTWISLGHERGFHGGWLEGSIGAGRHDASGGTRLAPWLAWQRALGRGMARLAAGRSMAPVWSDLAPGQPAFVQSTWSAAAQWAVERPGGHADLLVIGGRTVNPARVDRIPLEDLALRTGVRAGDDVSFVLAAGGVALVRGAWSAGAGGFALGRGDDGGARVDPRWGGRVFAGWRGALFTGDLGVSARLIGDAIGVRVAPGSAEPIPAYGTLGALVGLTLADATIVIEGRNLEGRVRGEPWIDPTTGAPALGAGTELRLSLRLKLYN